VGTSGQASSSRFNSTPDRGAFWELNWRRRESAATRGLGGALGPGKSARSDCCQDRILRRRRGVRPSALDPIALGPSPWHPGGSPLMDRPRARRAPASRRTYTHRHPDRRVGRPGRRIGAGLAIGEYEGRGRALARHLHRWDRATQREHCRRARVRSRAAASDSPIGSIETVALSPTGQAAAVPVGLPVSDLNPEASLTTGPLIAECYVLGSAGVYSELVRYE
jgi:hypothetical protein